VVQLHTGILGKDTNTHWIEGWVGPRANPDAVAKEKNSSPHLTGNQTSFTQPTA